jgi:uncharacterized protein (TIGR03435 family)
VKLKQCFSDDILAEFRDSEGLRIRAGTRRHRFIGIWFVCRQPPVDSGIPAPSADAAGPSIFTAAQEQLGMKLESGRGPVEL